MNISNRRVVASVGVYSCHLVFVGKVLKKIAKGGHI